MVYLYTGTPGSGKSMHVAGNIIYRLRSTKNNGVIANFPINKDAIPKPFRAKALPGRFDYLDNSELKPQTLIDYAYAYHKVGVEGQSVLIIDECQIIFNARQWQQNGREKWIGFFTQHRKLGFDIILICQFDRMVDRQIRSLVEIEVKHRKISNAGIRGQIFRWFYGAGKPVFAETQYWYGGNGIELSNHLRRLNKQAIKIYDSYGTFSLTGGTSEKPNIDAMPPKRPPDASFLWEGYRYYVYKDVA